MNEQTISLTGPAVKWGDTMHVLHDFDDHLNEFDVKRLGEIYEHVLILEYNLQQATEIIDRLKKDVPVRMAELLKE